MLFYVVTSKPIPFHTGEFTNSDLFTEVDEDIIKFTGGIPARSEKGERLLLFLGIIDILQQYKLKKKMEHAWKSAVHDGNSVSVTRPDFYKQRFLSFISDKIFPSLCAVPRPSSSSMPSSSTRPADVAATSMTTMASSNGDVVSPNNISITIDAGKANLVHHQSAVDQPTTPNNEESSQSPPVFGSPSDSVLTHDLTTGEVASETPSVHPPAFSTPTVPQQQQQQQQLQQHQHQLYYYTHDSKARQSSRSMASEVMTMSHEKCVVATNNMTLRVNNHITREDETSSSSLHADSNGIIGASDDIVADGTQLSHFDSSASSDVLRRIRQLEDSSLDSFVGEIPSELKVGSSLLESVVEDSVDLRHQPQVIHYPGMLCVYHT